MYDYRFADDFGREVSVMEMTDTDLHYCLNVGFQIEPGEKTRPEAIVERLRIEVLRRALSL